MAGAREIEEAILKRDLLLSRVSATEREKLLKVLTSLTKSLAAQMYELDDLAVMSPSKRMRIIKKFIKAGEKTINESFSGYGKEFNATLAEIIVFEAQQTGRELIKASAAAGTVNIKPETLTLTAEQAEMLLKDTWITNKSVSEMLDGQVVMFVNEFKKRVRRGYVSGQTNAQIARELKGYTDKDGIIHRGLDGVTAKNAEQMVRTSCLAMANTARLEMYRKNADIIRCVQWVATLDLRTCIHCAAMDGKYWYLDGQPIGHDIPFESPPVHRNCRCTVTPVLKSFSEIDENGNVVETITPSTRASKDGQVSDRLDFAQWFESLSEAEQEKYLGVGRWNLCKDGKITFSSLIDQNGRGLTVKELYQMLAKDLTSHNVRLPDEKFTQYLLSTENKVGKNKALVFSAALGYNIDNWQELKRAIQRGLDENSTMKRYTKTTEYGDKYNAAIRITGPNGATKIVTTAWIKRFGEPNFDFITAIVEREAKKQ